MISVNTDHYTIKLQIGWEIVLEHFEAIAKQKFCYEIPILLCYIYIYIYKIILKFVKFSCDI